MTAAMTLRRSMTAALLVGSLLGPIATPRTARADAPIDVVVLKDGGLVRGTISELKTGGDVTIVTVTGETRKIAMSDVTYAGPASRMPAAPGEPVPASPQEAPRPAATPLLTVNATGAPLTLRSTQSDVTFHVRTGTASGATTSGALDTGGRIGGGVGTVTVSSWTPICTAPCTATIASGSYTLGLSRGTGPVVAHEDLVRVNGPTTLSGAYKSRLGARIAGYVVLALGLGAGGYLMVHANGNDDSEELAAGGAITALSLVAGIVLVTRGDDAVIKLIPGTAGTRLPGRPSGGEPRATMALPPSGATLSASF